MNPTRKFSLTMIAVGFSTALLVSCGGSDDDAAPAPAPTAAPVAVPYTNGAVTTSNVIAYWNKIASDTISLPAAPGGTVEEQRPIILTDLATVHVAMYDAVNAIVATHRTFSASPTTATAGASQEAAAAAAAYGVLKGLFPSRSAQYQAAYDAYIAALPTDDAKTRGLAVGTEVASSIVALRASDGRSIAVSYTAGTAPGNFRGANPIGNFNRFVRHFTLTSPTQFRVAPPPPLDSAAYAADFNEVLTLGSVNSIVRTAAQTESARFHTENPGVFSPRNFRGFAMESRSLADNARLMAMLYVAQSDAINACFESKYFYDFWRPASAITLAATDSNPATVADTGWTPVVPTPNHPEYPSAHMCSNGAAMASVKAFFGTDKISFSYGSTVTGSVHAYASPQELLDEIVLARITGGMHFRFANVQGGVLGANVGEWVARNHFQPRN